MLRRSAYAYGGYGKQSGGRVSKKLSFAFSTNELVCQKEDEHED